MRRHLRVAVVALAITACPGPINTEDAGAGGGAAGGDVGGGNVGGGNVGGGNVGGGNVGGGNVGGGNVAGGNAGGGNVGGGNVGGGSAGGTALGSRRLLELSSGAARLSGGTLVMDAQLGAPLSQQALSGGTLRLEGSAVIAP